MTEYHALNRAAWDERAGPHANSPDYFVDRFLADPAYLSRVVRFDLPLLGDVKGNHGVHLQCHIGTDTVSLARLGARMTGLDFSPASLAQARRLAAATNTEIDFVEADLYDAVSALGGRTFDLVYTGMGALCWLPDIARWAGVVAELLAPGGRLFIREGHPMLWAIDETQTDRLVVEAPYFEHSDPFVSTEEGTYVQTDAVFEYNTTYSWNHGLGEIVTALLTRGLQITGLVEHDSIPWNGLPGQMEKVETGEYRLIDRPRRLALSYTLQAVKA